MPSALSWLLLLFYAPAELQSRLPLMLDLAVRLGVICDRHRAARS